MVHSGLSEEQVSRTEGMSLVAHHEETTSVDHYVQLILVVGFLLVNTQPEPVWASGMNATAGDYVLTVGTDVSDDEELLYVIDTRAEKLIVYRFDGRRHEIEVVQGIDLAELRDATTQSPQPQRGKKPASRRRRP